MITTIKCLKRLVLATYAAVMLAAAPAAHAGNQPLPAPAPFDTSACGTDPEWECVLRLKNIRSVQLIAEREALQVAAEREQLHSVLRNNHHTYSTLGGQRVASWVLLVMVLLIVGTGLRMSWLHMQNDFAKGLQADINIETSKDGAKFNSSVIGLAIFFISTFFFWVYVERVYTVTFIKPHSADATAQPAAPAAKPASEKYSP